MADANEDRAETEVDFEAALKALEYLVKQMESGELGLEASLGAFEKGVALTRQCQAALKQAELRVRTLTEDNELEDLDLGSLNDG